jgi:hypothetical protein
MLALICFRDIMQRAFLISLFPSVNQDTFFLSMLFNFTFSTRIDTTAKRCFYSYNIQLRLFFYFAFTGYDIVTGLLLSDKVFRQFSGL